MLFILIHGLGRKFYTVNISQPINESDGVYELNQFVVLVFLGLCMFLKSIMSAGN